MTALRARCLLFLGLAAVSVAPAQPPKEAGVPLLRNFTQQELQFAGQVWSVAQDRRGIMFFGSNNSLLEYDGATWRSHILPLSSVRHIVTDGDGRIWISGTREFGTWEPDSAGVGRYVSLAPKIPAEHRESGDVWQVVPTSRGIYFRSYARIFRWDGKQMRVWASSSRFEGLGEVQGRLYVVQAGIGLQELRNDELISLPGGEAYKSFARVFFHRFDERRILVTARYEQLSLYDGQKATTLATEADAYLKKAQPYTTIVLPDGAICIVTTMGGAAIVERDGRLRRLLNKASGLAGDSLTFAATDRDGHLWLTRSDGITRVEVNAPISVLAPGSTSKVVRHEGRLYAASVTSGQAVSRLESDPLTGYTFLRPIATGTSQAWSFIAIPPTPGGPPSQLIAGTGAGVLQIQGDTASKLFPARTLSVFGMLRSAHTPDRVILGLTNGLASMRWEGGHWIDEGYLPGFPERLQDVGEAADGSIWAGGLQSSVIRVEVPAAGMGAAKFERFGEKEGVPASGVRLASIGGEIYGGTPEGIVRFDAAKRRFVPDAKFLLPMKAKLSVTRLVPLPSGDVFAIRRFGTEQNQGLFHKQANGTYQLEEQPYRRLRQFLVADVQVEDDGAMTFSTLEGILRFEPRKQASPPLPFASLVREVTTGPEQIIYGGTPIPGSAAPAIPFATNSLRFQFSAATYGAEEETTYQYMLDGSDKNWSAPTTLHEASYNNIAPGSYRFRVRSRTADGREGEEAVFAFSIIPPWYRTNFAYLAYGVVMLLAGFVARQRIISREREKSRLATEALEKTVAARTAEIAAQRDNIELLGEIGKEITASLDLETVLFKLYECVNKIVDAAVFGVGLYRPEKNVIEYDLAVENGKRYAPYSRSTADKNQLAVWCVENRKPVLIGDVEQEYSRYISAYKHGARLLEDGSKAQAPASVIYLPLIAQDRVLGVLSIQSFKKNAYTAEHLSLLENLASYTTIALDNAGAYRRMNDRERELTTVNRITQALSTQLDTAGLIHLVGEQIRDVFHAQIAYVALLDRSTMMLHFPYTFGEEVAPRPFGDGLTSQIIRTGQPLLINQDMKGSSAKLGVENIGRQAASYLGVPIPSGGEIVGVISVQSTEEEGRFTPADQGLLTTIAASVGVAFHNARLFEETRQARAAAEEADAAKSTFLSTVSHELRTPLTSVIGFAKIIRKRLEERLFPLIPEDDRRVVQAKKQVADNLNVVVSEGERLTKLINDVLDLAKIEAGKFTWNMEEISITDVVERALASTSSLFDSKKLELIRRVEPDLPRITGDADRLIQVVINLLSNAVKFTDAGSVTCAASLHDGELIVSVADSGVGIRPEDQPKVFEKFKQVGDTLTDKPQGTGLGLPISKEIIEYHGGRMWLESTPGQGSTFFFALPVAGAAPLAKPKQLDIESLVRQLRENVAIHQPRPHSVLVVDDDPHIRALLQQELVDAGYTVRLAEDGRRALALVREEIPGLIILDVMMPEMNGFDVAAVLKNDPATADIPIIILSIVEDKERGFRLGVDRYLTKPIDTTALFREIGVLIDQGKSKKKVLVVDEDDSTIRTLAEVLEARGYQVMEANGAELVSKAVSAKPDIIVLSSLLSSADHVRALRFEKGMENVLFLIYQ